MARSHPSLLGNITYLNAGAQKPTTYYLCIHDDTDQILVKTSVSQIRAEEWERGPLRV